MPERSARWASAVARLLLLPPGVVITVQTRESSACRATVHSGFLAWKLKRHAGSNTTSVCNNNNWSKNFDERPHRRLVTPCIVNGFVRPWPHLIRSFLGPQESAPKTASRSVQPFLRTPLQKLLELFKGVGRTTPKISPFPGDLHSHNFNLFIQYTPTIIVIFFFFKIILLQELIPTQHKFISY